VKRGKEKKKKEKIRDNGLRNGVKPEKRPALSLKKTKQDGLGCEVQGREEQMTLKGNVGKQKKTTTNKVHSDCVLGRGSNRQRAAKKSKSEKKKD